MKKRNLIFSLLSFILVVIIFVSVVYAWFVLNSNTSLEAQVKTPLITSYEIHYFTQNNTYFYDSTTKNLLIYDETTSTWIEPIYDNIFLGQYDPYIPSKNEFNNLIIEFKINYTINSSSIINISSIVNPNLANDAINLFEPNIDPSNILYLSSFSFIQFLSVEQKVTSNTFESVTNTFEDPSYIKMSFNESKSELLINELSLDPLKNEQYFYLNISYNDQKILNTFSSIWGSNPVASSLYFYPDITFIFREKESL